MKRIIFIVLAFLSVYAFADVEIIVTASRIEEDSKTTPAYVQVIPEEEINKKTTILDVLKTIPDISVREVSPAKQSISMGGFGDNGFGRTLILINGRPVNRPDMASFDWNSIPLASVSRIEIVKGSMSSEYGDQAVAGVINIITKQPKGLTSTVSASVADTLSNKQSAFVSYGNKVSGVALGLNRIDNNPARDRSDSTILSANMDSFYNFAGIETKFGFNYSNSEYELPGGLTETQYNTNPDQAVNLEDSGSSVSYGVNGSVNFSLGDVDFFVPLSYSVLDYSSIMTSWLSFTDTKIGTVITGIRVSDDFYPGESTEISTVGGVDLKQHNLHLDKYSDAEKTTKVDNNEVSRTDTAAWSRVKINYLDTYIVNGGVRYNYSSLNTDPDVIHDELVYDAGFAYLVSQDLNMGFRYGKVFRYPFLDEQVSYYSGPVTVNTDLKPEKGNSYTIFAEYKNDTINFSISPYLISMEDEIMYNTETWQNENIGSTLHYGISVETGYSAGIAKVSGGYSYDHAEFTDTEKIIPRVPEHTVYAKVTVTPVKSVTVSTDGRYSSEYYIDDDNAQGTISGRFEWNIRADWNINDSLSVYFSGKNLLNDRTPTQTYWSSWTSQKAMYPMPGRTFETGLKWAY